MADDLANFIETQKRKLEQERAEFLRGANGEDQSRGSLRGHNEELRHSNRGPTLASEKTRKPPAVEKSSNPGGLNLGGYEKVQQRLRQERQDEYRKYLFEKNFRSTGRVDAVVLSDENRSPYPRNDSQQAPPKSNKREDGDEVHKDSLRHRRRGKENYDDSPRDYDYSYRRGNRKAENLFESYEDLLQRKRAQERKYRGFDEPDSDIVRPMRLNAPQYINNSRSDGYLNWEFDADDDKDEWRSRRKQLRGQQERSFESKRVRFQGEENRHDDMWVKPQRRLDYYDDDDDDEEELLEWLRKRGRRPQRRNSAHEPDRKTLKEESLQRSNTDSEIRSQSAPLEGAGVIGGHQESRSDKVKRQEQYKKELQSQMQEQAEIKKREKMQRLGVQQDGTTTQTTQLDKTPPSVNQGSYPQQPTNHGPSSRPPPHPAVYPNPYDDPYYYYGALEMGAPQAPSMGAPLPPPVNLPRVTVGPRADTQISGGLTTPAPAAVLQQSGGDTSPRAGLQPPGGYSSIGVLGSDQESAADKKRAAQQAYHEELIQQMQERRLKKQKEKEDIERYERKIEQEIANYNPWGKGGGGAPLRDSGGQLVANLRTLKQYNDEGIKVSPRDMPPPAQTRFEVTQQTNLSPIQGLDGQLEGTAVLELSGNVERSSFGRSDPLKEPQPQEDQRKAAQKEYQAYLRKQVEEKEKKKREELKRQKEEEELLEKKILEDRIKLQKDFEEEQEISRRKEEQARLKNEEIRAAQEAKKMEAEKKRKEMEEQRQAELKRKLDEELAAKKASAVETGHRRTPLEYRSSSPPIPTIAKQQQNYLQQRHVTPPDTTTASPTHPQQPEPASSTVADRDVLSQLTALRKQLKNEEKRVQQQIDHTTAVTKYSNVQHAPEDLGSRRSRRDVDVFQRVLATKNAAGKSDSEEYSAAQEFNRIKNEETSSLAEEFRSKFPGPVATNSVLDLQQQAFLMEQEDKLAALRSDINRQNKHLVKGEQGYLLSRRPVSRDSLLESESQFLAVDDPKDILPVDQLQSRPRQSSAREKRRWKQLEEMARNPKAYDTYKPPTPGGFSLNSVTSFNVDEVAAKNEERLRRLEMIQQGASQQGRRSIQRDPDQVLQRFIDEHRRPPLPSRLSDYPLEAETSFEPI